MGNSFGKEAIFSHFSAVIGLSGDLMAMINILCDAYIMIEIARAMLEMEVNEIDYDVSDTTSEVANIWREGPNRVSVMTI